MFVIGFALRISRIEVGNVIIRPLSIGWKLVPRVLRQSRGTTALLPSPPEELES